MSLIINHLLISVGLIDIIKLYLLLVLIYIYIFICITLIGYTGIHLHLTSIPGV